MCSYPLLFVFCGIDQLLCCICQLAVKAVVTEVLLFFTFTYVYMYVVETCRIKNCGARTRRHIHLDTYRWNFLQVKEEGRTYVFKMHMWNWNCDVSQEVVSGTAGC